MARKLSSVRDNDYNENKEECQKLSLISLSICQINMLEIDSSLFSRNSMKVLILFIETNSIPGVGIPRKTQVKYA